MKDSKEYFLEIEYEYVKESLDGTITIESRSRKEGPFKYMDQAIKLSNKIIRFGYEDIQPYNIKSMKII